MLIRITRDTVISPGRLGTAGSIEDVPTGTAALLMRLGKAAAVVETVEASSVTPQAKPQAEQVAEPVTKSPVTCAPAPDAPPAARLPVPEPTASGLDALPWRELRQMASGLGITEIRGSKARLIQLITDKQSR